MMRAEAQQVAALVKSLADFDWQEVEQCGYRHMGATLTDAGLQAGINYRHVVVPRVERVLSIWPEAVTTSAFLGEIERFGLDDVLEWKHPDKPRRIHDMAAVLARDGVETEDELADWLALPENSARLRAIRGVGPKTVDYLSSLVGRPAIAVDRHLITFATWAGVTPKPYDDMARIFRAAADLLEVGYTTLDRTVWQYVSSFNSNSAQRSAR